MTSDVQRQMRLLALPPAAAVPGAAVLSLRGGRGGTEEASRLEEALAPRVILRRRLPAAFLRVGGRGGGVNHLRFSLISLGLSTCSM
jgi:hypothetical protein